MSDAEKLQAERDAAYARWQETPQYLPRNERMTVKEPCPRCNGKGHLFQYKHKQGGVCFKCGGHGTILREKTVRVDAIRNSAYDQAEEEFNAARRRADEAWQEANPDAEWWECLTVDIVSLPLRR